MPCKIVTTPDINDSNDEANTRIQEEDMLHYMKKMLRNMDFIANGGHELSWKVRILKKKNTRICKFVDKGAIVQMKSLDAINRFVRADIGYAIVRSSWKKSGCEQKCCFPINGGLHRSSKDASSDTESLQILTWCHAIKFDSPSSRMTRFAMVASFDTWNEMATWFESYVGFWTKGE